jgi:hypothetical protein
MEVTGIWGCFQTNLKQRLSYKKAVPQYNKNLTSLGTKILCGIGHYLKALHTALK